MVVYYDSMAKRLVELDDVDRLVIANFRRLRIERGWTQEALAEKANCSVGYIGQIERYHSSFSLRAKLKFSKVFRVNRLEFYQIPLPNDEIDVLSSYRRLRDLNHGDEALHYLHFLISEALRVPALQHQTASVSTINTH